MNDAELAYDGRAREIERTRNILRNEFSASLRNATPEVHRWIELQINKSALERFYRSDEDRRKRGISK